MRRGRQVPSREQWFEVIRGRLGDLVRSGMSKAFLVRSVRDSIRRMLDYSGAEIGERERDRAEMRERIQRMLEDPAELAVFRRCSPTQIPRPRLSATTRFPHGSAG
jgi:hypothetical protein